MEPSGGELTNLSDDLIVVREGEGIVVRPRDKSNLELLREHPLRAVLWVAAVGLFIWLPLMRDVNVETWLLVAADVLFGVLAFWAFFFSLRAELAQSAFILTVDGSTVEIVESGHRTLRLASGDIDSLEAFNLIVLRSGGLDRALGFSANLSDQDRLGIAREIALRLDVEPPAVS